MPFTMHGIFCATPGDLEAERQAFYEVIGEVNEAEGMAKYILFMPVSIVPNMVNKLPFQPVIEANIRDCSFFVQVLQNTWGPPERNFAVEYQLACRLKADPASPMEGVSVFFKAADGLEVEPAIVQLKSSAPLQTDCRAYHFSSLDEYKQLLRGQLCTWLRGVTDSGHARET